MFGGGIISASVQEVTFPSQSRDKEKGLTEWPGLVVPKNRLINYLLLLNLSRNWGKPRHIDINYYHVFFQ